MNLRQCLDMLKTNILYDRSDRVDGTPDWLWSDETLVTYINEAQRRFARLGLVIRDGTSDVTRVTIIGGQIEYTLDPSILAVMSVRFPGDTADLARASHSALDTYTQPDSLYFDAAQLSMRPPGKPLAFATDEYLSGDDYDSMSVVNLRIYPVPLDQFDGAVLQMRVVRMPMEDLTLDNLDAVPEIPRDYHLPMLDWAAYLALRIVDVDGGMPAMADKFAASFNDQVQTARRDTMRKLFAPAPWSFGRNGFSWESWP